MKTTFVWVGRLVMVPVKLLLAVGAIGLFLLTYVFAKAYILYRQWRAGAGLSQEQGEALSLLMQEEQERKGCMDAYCCGLVDERACQRSSCRVSMAAARCYALEIEHWRVQAYRTTVPDYLSWLLRVFNTQSKSV